MAESGHEASLGELFAELTREVSTLVRQEVQLAKTEMTQKAGAAARGSAALAVAALLTFVGFQALIAAAIIGLALYVEWWLAAVVVGVVLLVAGGILLMSGLAKLKASADMVPHATIETLKEDAQWMKEQRA